MILRKARVTSNFVTLQRNEVVLLFRVDYDNLAIVVRLQRREETVGNESMSFGTLIVTKRIETVRAGQLQSNCDEVTVR